MELSVENLGKLRRKISVEVPLSEVKSAYDEIYTQIKSHIKVDGFRPGKFPRNLAEKRFQVVMTQEATMNLVPKYFAEAQKQMKERAATQPQFSDLEIDKNKPFSFRAEFEVVPNFELPDPKDFTLERKKAEVKPEEVEARIEEYRISQSTLENIGPAKAKKGNVVTVNFEGRIDGEPFQGNKGQGQKVDLGAGSFLEEFESALVGAEVGDSLTFPVNFPREFHPELAGKKADFEVEVISVEKKVLPELNKELFSQFGKFETLEAFKADTKRQLLHTKEGEVKMAYQEEVSRQFKEKFDFEVPETLLNKLMEDFLERLPKENPEALKDDKKLAELQKEQQKKLAQDLRLTYIIDEWARAKKIEIKKDEVDQQFYIQAYMAGQDPAKMRKTEQGERALFRIEKQMLSDRVFESIVSQILSKGGGGKQAQAPDEVAKKKKSGAKPKK